MRVKPFPLRADKDSARTVEVLWQMSAWTMAIQAALATAGKAHGLASGPC